MTEDKPFWPCLCWGEIKASPPHFWLTPPSVNVEGSLFSPRSSSWFATQRVNHPASLCFIKNFYFFLFFPPLFISVIKTLIRPDQFEPADSELLLIALCYTTGLFISRCVHTLSQKCRQEKKNSTRTSSRRPVKAPQFLHTRSYAVFRVHNNTERHFENQW